MEHRGCGGRVARRRARRRLPAAQPAHRQLFGAGRGDAVADRTCKRGCTRCPSTRTGFRIAPATTGAAGDSASPHETRRALRPGNYRVEIKSSLAPGFADLRRTAVPGRSREEVLFFTHVCHPSLANDNTSGMAVATALAEWIASEPRRFTYRFVFAPGTIGSLCWLKQNERKPRAGAGRAGARPAGRPGRAHLQDEPGRRHRDRRDRGLRAVAGWISGSNVMPFSPYGYDERQLCSPGFNLPVGRLTRSVNGGYPQYHTSADDLRLITPECLEQSLAACKQFVTRSGGQPALCQSEAQRASRGSASAVCTAASAARARREREHAMLWVLNQSDGSNSLLDIARRSGLAFDVFGRPRSRWRRRPAARTMTATRAGSRRRAPAAARAGPERVTRAPAPQAGEREPSHESRPVLRGAGHAAARALGHHSQAAGQRRLSADPVAPDALLRALRPHRIHPLPRLSRRSDPRVLPALRRGDDQRLHAA